MRFSTSVTNSPKTRVSSYRLPLSSGSLFKHLHVHAQRLLNGVFGDEVDKVLDVGLPVGRQLVDGWLPHHGLGDGSGVVCEVDRSPISWPIPKVESYLSHPPSTLIGASISSNNIHSLTYDHALTSGKEMIKKCGWRS